MLQMERKDGVMTGKAVTCGEYFDGYEWTLLQYFYRSTGVFLCRVLRWNLSSG